MTCKECKFWEESGEYSEGEYDEQYDFPSDKFRRGECRRYAPSPIVTESIDNDGIWEAHYNATRDVMWPHTRNYQWCGEFKEKEQSEI